MALEIRLLGAPSVLRDGEPVPPPRGAKPWGLMAYLLLNPNARSRSRLISMLFPEAEDPLAALRWNLNALRRLLSETETFRGDPIEPRLPSDSWVDVIVMRSGSWPEAIELAGLGHDLLEGLHFGESPGFEAWLTAERRHVANDAEAILREASLVQLAASKFTEAAETSGRLVALNPLDEGAHELFVRSLAAGGQQDVARAHLQHAAQLIRKELGIEPGPELLSAADPAPKSRPVQAISVKTALEAGMGMVYAGHEKGVGMLRSAVDDARSIGEPNLLLRALLTYVTALSMVDSVEGESGAAAVHEGVMLAEEVASPGLRASAHWLVAFGEYWRGRYGRAETWLDSGADLAQGDPLVTGRISYVRGCILTERARYEEAFQTLQQAVSSLDEETQPYALSFAVAMLGRAYLLAGSLEPAEEQLDRAVAIARHRWAAFLPWAEALRGDVALNRGELGDASDFYEHAYGLACHHYRSNRCQTLAARGLGLVSAAKGDIEGAVRWLDVARTRFSPAYPYPWFRGYALEALCGVAVEHRLPGAATWIASLEELAGRHGMVDLLIRGLVHRGRLGDGEAASAAQSLSAEIASPSLHALVAA